MEKEARKRRQGFGATPLFFLFLVPFLAYVHFYMSNVVPIDRWMQRFSSHWTVKLSRINTNQTHVGSGNGLIGDEFHQNSRKQSYRSQEGQDDQLRGEKDPLIRIINSENVTETEEDYSFSPEETTLGNKILNETKFFEEVDEMVQEGRDGSFKTSGPIMSNVSEDDAEVSDDNKAQEGPKPLNMMNANLSKNEALKDSKSKEANGLGNELSNMGEANGTANQEEPINELIEKLNRTVAENKAPSTQRARDKNQTVQNEESFSGLTSRSKNETAKELKSLESPLARLVAGEDRARLEATGFACDSTFHSLVCVANLPVRIDTRTMTVHLPPNRAQPLSTTVVRPYARQHDKDLLDRVRPVQILHGNTSLPVCNYTHDVPAVIFSSSGFAGNLFHEFNEIIIPLFLTSHHFESRVQFILENYKPSIVRKYERLFSHLSSYGVMNPTENASVHCFSGAVAGLKFHDHLGINSSDTPKGYTISKFRQFLRDIYGLKFKNVSEIKQPTAMLISRPKTRRFLNEKKMIALMKDLGFKVIVSRKHTKMARLYEFAKVVNSCSVLVGTHGAGLTNELFLPESAVLVQVEPLGLEWASEYYFGKPAREMGLHYIRYLIEPEESSLLGAYGRDDPVISDPDSIHAKGYQVGRAVYLDQQSIKMDLIRFREILLETLRLTRF